MKRTERAGMVVSVRFSGEEADSIFAGLGARKLSLIEYIKQTAASSDSMALKGVGR